MKKVPLNHGWKLVAVVLLDFLEKNYGALVPFLQQPFWLWLFGPSRERKKEGFTATSENNKVWGWGASTAYSSSTPSRGRGSVTPLFPFQNLCIVC